MTSIGSYLLTGFAAVLAIPTVTFFLETIAGSLQLRRKIIIQEPRPGRVAVLIPAHNEGAGIGPTLEDVRSQLSGGDRLVVVIDNCTDNTAEIAVATGAEITVRNDPTKIGKGYALDWGLSFLNDDAPDIVIVVDADCRVLPGAINRLAGVCAKQQRPVQALYLITSPGGSAVNHQVAEFAWRIRNWFRPLGLAALGLPCQLMGSGMAFPWKIVTAANLSTGSIVEDLKLGLELAAAGFPPTFCPSAIITSTFPNSAEGTTRQRQRWEHGHVGLILTLGPRLLYRAIRYRDLNLLALVLDLVVPPVSLLGAILVATTCGTAVATLAGMSSTAFTISWISLAAAFTAIVIGWIMHGRDCLPARSLGLIPYYLFMKLRLYGGGALGKRVTRWIRTDRA
jgi:cellulose synthase/poly-beta-1,6-N-acetylglucosamine synthase-like glycosyltransferase